MNTINIDKTEIVLLPVGVVDYTCGSPEDESEDKLEELIIDNTESIVSIKSFKENRN